MWKCALVVWFAAVTVVRAGEGRGDWTGDYPPCDRHAELLSHGPLNLGVRFETANAKLQSAFARALDYWAAVLDMDWHREDSRNCAIEVVDGYAGLFQRAEVARTQLPGWPCFQGWIAFNPKFQLQPDELFRTSVHELGHLLGLPHNTNASSAMYFLCLDGPITLDASDLAALAVRHKLRGEISLCPFL